MKKISLSILSTFLISSLYATNITLPEKVDGYTISEEIKVSGQLRPRYDFNNYEAVSKDIHNVSNRITLNALWEASYNLKFQLGFLNVSSESNIKNSDREHYLVKDVDNTTLPVASVFYNFINADTVINIGRQKLTFNDEKFIGVNDWRQQYRTFDAIYLKNNSFENFIFEMAYSLNSNDAHDKTDMFVLNGTLNIFSDNPDFLNFSFYDYMIEDTSDTIGIIGNTKLDMIDFDLNFRGEYAFQNDPMLGSGNSSNPSYYSLIGGFSTSSFDFNLGYSSEEKDFKKPYGSIHEFNGFTDNNILNSDIDTFSGSLKYNFNEQSNLKFSLFDFSKNSSNTHLGSEFDVDFNYDFAKNLNFYTELGYFVSDRDNLIKDNLSFSVQLNYKF